MPDRGNLSDTVHHLMEHISFPETKVLLDYWHTLVDQMSMEPPDRGQIDPLSFLSALPYVYIACKSEDNGRICYELSGEEINRYYGHSLKGRCLDEITPDTALDRVSSYFSHCMESPAITLITGVLFAERENPGYGERLLLPLVDNRSGFRALIGLTRQEYQFKDKDEAFQASKRVSHTYSLKDQTLETAEFDAPSIISQLDRS